MLKPTLSVGGWGLSDRLLFRSLMRYFEIGNAQLERKGQAQKGGEETLIAFRWLPPDALL